MVDCYKQNSNASIQAQSGSAFVGVILRDHCGFVVVSCVVDIGICPVVSAESWVVCINWCSYCLTKRIQEVHYGVGFLACYQSPEAWVS